MRRCAVQTVPFSSIFYCSNPLAAALTRKRFQAFFLLFSLIHLPDFINFARWREYTIQHSKCLRFTILQLEGLDTLQTRQVTFGITMDGEVQEVMERQSSLDNTFVFNFSTVNAWNGWFFEIQPPLHLLL